MKNTVLFIIFVFTYLVTFAQPPDKGIQANLEEYLTVALKTENFSGSVLVAKNGKVLLSKGYGMANYAYNIANTPATKLRIASLTKAFTAVLALQLAEKGKLRLDGKVREYLPDYPSTSGDSITIHHLLSHTSGLPHYGNIPDYFEKYARVALTQEEYIQVFSNIPLLFPPGTKYSYSSPGYFLLGVILEKVSGKSYDALLKENITAPLGMRNTLVEHTDSIIENKAAGYDYLFDFKRDFKYKGLANATYEEMSKAGGAGQLLSTVDDLFKWNQALSSEKLLSKKYLDLLFKPNLANYAYGWNISNQSVKGSSTKMKVAEHGGSGLGFLSHLYKNLDNGDFIVILSNRSNAAVKNMIDDIKAILYNESYSMPKLAVLPDESGNVTFRLKGYPTANKVFVSGEFNNWIPWQTFLTKNGDEWLCQVNLDKGTYKYMFVVDGKWIPDPDNPLQDKTSFTSSVLKVK